MEREARGQIVELEQRLKQGEISRRDFLRAATLLGLSLGANEFLTGCSTQPTATPSPTFYDPVHNDPAILTAASKMGKPAGSTEPAGTEHPTAVETQPRPTSTPVKRIEWLCDSCGLHFRTLDDLKRHAATEHAWRLPETKRVDQPTYSQYLVGTVERFDEKNTVFSRTGWDQDYQKKVQEAIAKAGADDWKTFEGKALVAGAIYVDDTAGSFHEYYPGYFGHVRDSGGLYNWDDPVNPIQYPAPDPVWMSARIKEVARFYGANLVGICKVNPNWIYSNYYELVTGRSGRLEMPYPYAIVMGIEMDWKTINTSPKPEASAATALAYSRMSELSASLAKYIRALGYPAIPCGNDTGQSIPLAIDAGLGELGRNGLLLTPEYGPRQRICKVFTSLPLQIDQPIDFGAGSFCDTCGACAKSCPAKAILSGDRTTEQTSISNRPGILRWPVNVANCYLFWKENGVDCSNCIASCPWALHSQRDWLEL
jgi:epoxyqueuosine reductase